MKVEGFREIPSIPLGAGSISFPMGDFFACETCGAFLHIEDLETHDRWHETLRRAVDESEMLG